METKNYSDNFVTILLCDIHDTMKLFAFLLPAVWMVESSTVSLCFKTHFMVLRPRHKTAEKHRCLEIRICLCGSPEVPLKY